MYTSNGITLKPIEENDLEFMREIRNHPSTWSNLTSISFISKKSQAFWYDSLHKDSSRMYFMIYHKINEDEEILHKIGYARADEVDYINRSIRIGLDIHMDYRNQGLGTLAFKTIVEMFLMELNFNRLWLLVLAENFPAIKVYKKIGFIEEGVMRKAVFRSGKYIDYLMMGLLREEFKVEKS